MSTAVELCNALVDARISGNKLNTKEYPLSTLICDSYRLQEQVLDSYLQKVQTFHRGWKVALSGQAAKEKYQLIEPVYGQLTTDMQLKNNSQVKMQAGEAIKLEVEIAFILKKNLKCQEYLDQELLDAVGLVIPALEIVNIRWLDWDFSLSQFLVDNAAANSYILGQDTGLDINDLKSIQSLIQQSSHPITESLTSQDNPLINYLWLVRTLLSHGKELKVDDVILTGSLIRPLNVTKGIYQFKVLDQTLSVKICI